MKHKASCFLFLAEIVQLSVARNLQAEQKWRIIMESVWSNIKLPKFESLSGDIKTDVLVIGGGMAGILCASLLKEKGVDYTLVEGKTICSGITKNTTAKITSQHGLIYDKLRKSVGLERTKMYLDANQAALKKYFELCKDIDCDFKEETAYAYSLTNQRKLENEVKTLSMMGFTAGIAQTSCLPFPIEGAVSFSHQAQFHPLKFIAYIVPHLKIYEHTFVRELTEKKAVTEKGDITFQKLIFATHFPIDNKHGMYFLKMYQNRSYVIALSNAAEIDGMYVDGSKHGFSFRNYKDYLLLGGGSHRTGRRGGNWKELRDFARKYYPGSVEKYFWAAQDCITLDGIPYIGNYSKNMPNCYVATGFNKWGMTSSMAAAMILSDLVTERENPYAEVFEPSRNMKKTQVFLNCCEAAASLLSISKKRCPHMGCALKWNHAEHSYDCPCHGSRFDKEGTLLDNPANGNLSP